MHCSPKVALACMQKGCALARSCEMKAPGLSASWGGTLGEGGFPFSRRLSVWSGVETRQSSQSRRSGTAAEASRPQSCRAWTWQEGGNRRINPLFPLNLPDLD